MKTPSPRQIVLFTSFAISFIAVAFILILNWLLQLNIPILYIALYPIAMWVIIYVLLRFSLERFVNDKIKIIYKTIGKPRKFYRELRDSNKNIIRTVEHDVAEWAINKNKQIRELKKLETYRREFVGNVSHELKTPIFAAQGFIETLIDGGYQDENINLKYLQKTGDNIDRLNAIIEELETISKYEAGQMHLSKSAFDIWTLCKENIEDQEILALDSNMEFKIPPQKDAVMVYADKFRIGQVLSNLFSNAIKYGGENGTCIIEFYDLDEKILIEVSDNGPGISEEDLPRLFERFFRAEKSRNRKFGGTGLGLSIVKNILESHDQNINVRSEVGVGTTFSFTLDKYLPKD